MRIAINLSATTAADLIQLGRTPAIGAGIGTPNSEVLADVITHLVRCASAGVQGAGAPRPGWEASWVSRAFGGMLDAPLPEIREGADH